MKKQVVLYSEVDAWECKLCIFSGKMQTENQKIIVYACYKNKMKFHEEKCSELITNETLLKKMNKESPRNV